MLTDSVPKHLPFIQWRTLSCNGEMSQMINHVSWIYVIISNMLFEFFSFWCIYFDWFVLLQLPFLSVLVLISVILGFMFLPMYPKWRWRKSVAGEKKVKWGRKGKVKWSDAFSPAFDFHLKSFWCLTMSLVLFCCPNARGGLVDLGVALLSN